MQKHLERFPTHKMNTTEEQVDSELQDIFKTLQETPSDSKFSLILHKNNLLNT